MPNPILDKFPGPDVISSADELNWDELAQLGSEMHGFNLKPWQLFRVENRPYLLNITDGASSFSGYIFDLNELNEGLDDIKDVVIGFFAMVREKVRPISVVITYPDILNN